MFFPVFYATYISHRKIVPDCLRKLDIMFILDMNSDSWDDYGGESDFGDLKYGMVTFADLLSSLAQGISDDRDIFSFLAFDKNVKGLVSLSLSQRNLCPSPKHFT